MELHFMQVPYSYQLVSEDSIMNTSHNQWDIKINERK